MRIRKFVFAFFMVVLFSSLTTISAASSENIDVYIDGELQSYDQPPILLIDTTMVPMRGIFERLGAAVDWDDKTHTVTATKDGKTIILQIDSDVAFVNGKAVKLPKKVQLINSRTMVPLRFISESLGAEVEWDGTTRTVHIHSNDDIVLSTSEIVLLYDKSIIQIEVSDDFGVLGTGSGFSIGDGLFVTNYHVMEGGTSAEIITVSDEHFEVDGVLYADDENDLAIILSKAAKHIPPVKLGDATQSSKGDKVIAIGSPIGLVNTVSEGIISNFRTEESVNLIQISVPITYGSSGGALFNERGEVIGVTTMGFLEANLNFAVSTNELKPWLDELEGQDLSTLEISFIPKDITEEDIISQLIRTTTHTVIDGLYDNPGYEYLDSTEAIMFLSLNSEQQFNAFNRLSEVGKKSFIYRYVSNHWGDVLGVSHCYTYVTYLDQPFVLTDVQFGMNLREMKLYDVDEKGEFPTIEQTTSLAEIKRFLNQYFDVIDTAKGSLRLDDWDANRYADGSIEVYTTVDLYDFYQIFVDYYDIIEGELEDWAISLGYAMDDFLQGQEVYIYVYYADTYDEYPAGFDENEISYLGDNEWVVVHSIIEVDVLDIIYYGVYY